MNPRNKGITLVELLVYMAIFSIIFLSILSSVFYLQKIIQDNNQNYYVKNQIYFNLNILQEYLYNSQIKIENNELQISDGSDNLIMTQYLASSTLKNKYVNKEIDPLPLVQLETYAFELTDNNRILKFETSWKNNRNKIQTLTEYLVVINHKL